ncbi:hypothetical protein BDW22DRAFT_1327181 [Trametopsis cervina]|nr:hypothetical protein BDW22DRAFT_1327181 [Trametopsis cervina]
MNSNKYASLPDIDTAPDVYETEDVFHNVVCQKEDSSDDEQGSYSRSHARGRNGEHARADELDASSLNKDEASKKFRKAENRRPRPKVQYTYPTSPTSSASGRDSPSQHWPSSQKLSVSQRIAKLKAEVSALEAELASKDESKDKDDEQANPGEFIRELAEVKARLNKAGSSGKKDAARAKLVNAVMHDTDTENAPKSSTAAGEEKETLGAEDLENVDMLTFTADIDRRLGTLEKIIGSSTAALDETSPLLPPLMVTVTRLHSMLSLLSQPRHLDNVSRRLKLIQPDLERTSNANATHAQQSASASTSQRRQSSGHPLHSSISSANGVPTAPAQPTSVTRSQLEQLTPILTRLAPILPNIPHILTRLRSLSALHTNAAAFQTTLERLEEQQAKERADLADLEKALEGIEKSIKDNEVVVRKNVEGLETRIDGVVRRIEELDVNDESSPTS